MSEWDFAFGLTGQALDDALSSGATYEEWAMINRQLEREVAVGEHGKNVFAFIDAENVPSKFYDQIDHNISYLADRWSAKVYALQKDNTTIGWHEVAKANDCLKEIRLSGGPAKNKVDAKIIKDIRRLIRNCVPDETCAVIVSSDSDYKGVVGELKKAGFRVIGIGEAKSNEVYRNSFDSFIELDEFDVEDDVEYNSHEPLPTWYVGGSDAYRWVGEPRGTDPCDTV